MARAAMAQETICALRRKIARIEGTLPERLIAPQAEGGQPVLRRGGRPEGAAGSPWIETGVPRLDTVLDGGLPRAALTEIYSVQTRDAGAAAGFVLALAALLRRREGRLEEERGTVCWIGTSELFREAGIPYAPGLEKLFGLSCDDLLFCAADKLADVLWIAEEAARLKHFSAVVLEIRGNPVSLDLTATRRLHRRAQETGRPLFLIREAAEAEPTAAPVRLQAGPAAAGLRTTPTGLLNGSIGPPAFTVTISKSRTAPPARFVLEWNPHEYSFREIRPAHSRALVPASGVRPHPPAAGGAVVALGASGSPPAPGDQPPREKRPAHRRPRRAG